MGPSEWIALGAFLLSGFAVWRAERASRRTGRLEELQIREYEEAERERNRGRVRVGLSRGSDPNAVLFGIVNRGRGRAANVRVEVVPLGGSLAFMHGEMEKLPIAELHPGETVHLEMAPTMGDAIEYEVTTHWTDPDGTERTGGRQHLNITAV